MRSVPDLFLSHQHLTGCLASAAYANNQWRLDAEIVDDLHQTSFFKAMNLPTTKGTISIVDHGGVCFSRIWW